MPLFQVYLCVGKIKGLKIVTDTVTNATKNSGLCQENDKVLHFSVMRIDNSHFSDTVSF